MTDQQTPPQAGCRKCGALISYQARHDDWQRTGLSAGAVTAQTARESLAGL